MNEHGFSHLNAEGQAHMVDVTPKESTHRRAVARCRVEMQAETAHAITSGAVAKGDVFSVARIAGIAATKRTSDLIPLCHPILIGAVDVSFTSGETWVDIQSSVSCHGPTGVEMEALTACTAAALTIYDMCKAVDRAMTITDVRLELKTGGRSGEWKRPV